VLNSDDNNIIMWSLENISVKPFETKLKEIKEGDLVLDCEIEVKIYDLRSKR